MDRPQSRGIGYPTAASPLPHSSNREKTAFKVKADFDVMSKGGKGKTVGQVSLSR